MSILNVIRCDLPQNEYLVWKWRLAEGGGSRANQIRWGSSLRVRQGETAAFFYSTGAGTSPVDIIEGPADQILQTKNLPVLANIIGLAYGGDSPFQAEVFFINQGQATQMPWGVPSFDAFDPRFPDFPVPVKGHGTITFWIKDVKRFIEVQRLDDFDPARLAAQIRPQLTSVIKANLVTLAAARGIPLVQIGGRTEDLSVALQPTASKILEEFGLALRNFAIEGLELNKESEGFKDLMRVTKDIQLRRLEAQAGLEVKSMEDSQRINTVNMEDSLARQREELQRMQRLQTETQFLAAHRSDLGADVAKTAAGSMATMGQGGGGGGDGGGGAFGGVGAAALMMGMGLPVGASFGQQIASSLNQTFANATGTPCPRCGGVLAQGAKFCPQCGNPIGAPAAPFPAAAPTPVAPSIQIHVARNKQQLGVFPLDEVNRQLAQGILAAADLGWHAGLSGWTSLASIPGVVVPPPPLPSSTPTPPPLA